MTETVLFKPSAELIEMLFRYHKTAGRKIERETLTVQRIAYIQEKLSRVFRFSLVEFGIEMLELPLRLCAVVEADKPGFTLRLNRILQKHLRVRPDPAGYIILEKLSEEFKNWLESIGESLEAEEEHWPYKRVYLMDNGNVIMDLNLTGVTVSVRSIH